MERILNSNQPVAWAFVPVTGCGLFLISVVQGTVDRDSWPAFLAIIFSAWLLHRMHADSGMRTRPGSIPSWIWVLIATPLLGMVPDEGWWSFPCFLMGMKSLLGLRDTEQAPGTMLSTGAWWSSGLIVCPDMWCFVVAMTCAAVLVRRPTSEEWASALIGLVAPLMVLAALYWLWNGTWPSSWTWTERGFTGMPSGAAWLLVPTGFGWFVRQQSLITATAQQRFARQWTQWAGILGVALVIAIQAAHWAAGHDTWSYAMTAAPMSLAFMAAWTWPWLMPPGYKWTKVAPFVFLLSSLALLLLKGWSLL